MGKITISLPDDMSEFVDAQVGKDFADLGAYVLELIRRDQEETADLQRIVSEARMGQMSTRTTAEIFAEAIATAKARGTYRD